MRCVDAIALLLSLLVCNTTALRMCRPLRARVLMSASSSEVELKKLQNTLAGLSADGFPPEALAPLESQIAALEERIAAAAALPPLSAEQRRMYPCRSARTLD